MSLLEATAGMIPREKWFSNLATVGNVGAASIWVMLEAFLRDGRLKRGARSTAPRATRARTTARLSSRRPASSGARATRYS